VPRRFHLGERTVEAVEVIDRWLAPDHSYFKVRGDDGGVYILRYDMMSDRWEMTMFDSGRRPKPTLAGGRSGERSIT
jgi:hypothetical protein